MIKGEGGARERDGRGKMEDRRGEAERREKRRKEKHN